MKKLFFLIVVLSTVLAVTCARAFAIGTLRSTSSTDPPDEVNHFNLGDEVYVKGLGLMPGVRYIVRIVYDQASWVIGSVIPSAVPGTLNPIVNTDGNGDFALTLIWPLAVPGDYDIVADCIDYGILNQFDSEDSLDDFEVGTAGFLVIPEISVGTIAVLLVCLASMVVKRVF